MATYSSKIHPLLARINGDEPIPLLSQSYGGSTLTFAYCQNCDRLYTDDLPQYGSIKCPTCEWALIRGITPEALKDGRL